MADDTTLPKLCEIEGPAWLLRVTNPEGGWIEADLRNCEAVTFHAAKGPGTSAAMPEGIPSHVSLALRSTTHVYFYCDAATALRIRDLWLSLRSRMERLP